MIGPSRVVQLSNLSVADAKILVGEPELSKEKALSKLDGWTLALDSDSD